MNQQAVEVTNRYVSQVNGRHSIEVDRDVARSCKLIGDPTEFIVNLKQEIGRMRRYSDSSCLLAISPSARVDIMALDVLGVRFADNLRSYDAICRYGAARFLVLLPHVMREDIEGIIRRLQIQAVGYPIKMADTGESFVAATAGGAMIDASTGMQENIDRAVMACQTAFKQDGDAGWLADFETP